MTDFIDAFFNAWGEADAALQAKAIKAALGDGARYCDPRSPEALIGTDAIAGYVSQFSEMVPGATANVVRNDTRDGVARVTVEFRMTDGQGQLGQYFVESGSDGKPVRLVGFVGLGAAE